MDELSGILKLWDTSGDIEYLLRQDVFRDPDAIQKSLLALSTTEREKAAKTLHTLISALECYLDDLSTEHDDVKSQIEASLKSAKACLSYGSGKGT